MKKVFQSLFVGVLALTVFMVSCKDEETSPVFSIDTTSNDFGEIQVQTSSSKTFTITNTGDADLKITAFSFEGTNKAEFSTNGTSKSIAPKGTYTFAVTFTPNAEGARSATLKIAYSNGSQAIALSGKGTPQPKPVSAIDASNKDFGDVEVSQTAEHLFTVTNTGNADLKITAATLEGTNKAEFATDATATTIAPNGTYSFKATFAPTSDGAKTATLKIEHSLGTQSISLLGTGVASNMGKFINDDEIMAYYPFNKNTNDVSRNKYHGDEAQSHLGADDFIVDRHGKKQSAIHMDGNSYVTFPSTIPFGKKSFSVSTWLKVDTTVADGSYYILAKRYGCGYGKMFTFAYHKDKNSNYKNRLGFGVRSDYDTNEYGYEEFSEGVAADYDKMPTDWIHIVAVVDAEKGELTLYVNGIKTSTTSWYVSRYVVDVTKTAPFSIANSSCIGADGSKRYKGEIDDILLINRVLTKAEIKELYQK